MLSTYPVTCLFVMLTLVQSASSATVLMIPCSHYSYINTFTVFGKTLVSAGHEVHMFTLKELVPKVEKAGLKPVPYTVPDEANHQKVFTPIMTRLFKGEASSWDFFQTAMSVLRKACESISSDENIWNTIKDTKYDLVVLDGIFYCNYIFPYRLGVPYITIAFLHDPWAAGLPAMPSMETLQAGVRHNPRQMTFLQRTSNFLMYLMRTYLVKGLGDEELVRRFAPEKPVINPYTLYSRSDMFLVLLDNMCFDYPRISAPHYRYLAGGGSAEPPKKLQGEFENFVSGADNGVILVAFGSQESIKVVFEIVADKVIEAFRGLKERVILQYNASGKHNMPPNVLAREWLPQNDILGHPKTKLFISHCGANSQMEALYHSVPIICVPFQMEQEYNSARVENNRYGVQVDIRSKDFNSEDLHQAIRKVIDDREYSDNIKKCSAMLKSLPSVQETFLFWVEHVLTFGSDHLKPPSVGMPLYELFMLDVIAFLSLIFFVIFLVLALCIRKVCRRCFVQTLNSKKPKQQ